MNESWTPDGAGVDEESARPPSEATPSTRFAEAEEATSLVDDLVVVSNRQPYRHTFEDDSDDLTVDRPAGGLTAGLDPVLQRIGGVWIAWGDGDADRSAVDADDCVAVPPENPQYTLERLWLTDDEVEGYYEGYSNQALWPLCHSMPDVATFDADHWRAYNRVNRRFAEAVVDRAGDGSTVWFHDYHFARTPRFVRRELSEDAFLMQFWHIPWPSPDVFRLCPQREEVVQGLLGNDLLAFHAPRYCATFLESVEATLEDAVIDWGEHRVYHDGASTAVGAFPMGVDTGELAAFSREADGSFVESFEDEQGLSPERNLVLGVDRLDYTKGIPERLAALERLWENRPAWRGEFSYFQKGTLSRSNIPAYRELQTEVETSIERINDRFGTDDWQPIASTTEMIPREDLCALYRAADVALVTPVRDGMNLVAQEYVAAQVENDGVLVLSEFTGAHDELGEDALSVNPYDTETLAATIVDALSMDPEERAARMNRLRRSVHDRQTDAWIDGLLGAADAVRAGGSRS